MRESKFQASVIKDLRDLFEGIFILKNDANYLQGVPDLLLLHKDRWAMLEVKESFFASYQPNQEYYLDKLHGLSFALMICPENKEEVFEELYQHFR